MVYPIAFGYFLKTISSCLVLDSPKLSLSITGWFDHSSKNSYLRVWGNYFSSTLGLCCSGFSFYVMSTSKL